MIHRLPDGRDLSYREYGDLQGVPVFFFHGMPGSSVFRPPDEVTERFGVRLICAERPGYGRSSFQPNRRILDWAQDIASLADALGLQRFHVAGHSGGGPHTLACAYAFPERVISATVLSGAAPMDAPGITDGIMRLHALGLTYGKFVPWTVWRVLTWFLFGKLAADPSQAIDNDRDNRPQVDNEVLDIPAVRQNCMESDVEAYRQGLLPFAWESFLLTHPWGFALNKIRVPTYLWHGTVDNSTTLAMARYMEKEIPHSKLFVCEGEGHMLLIPHWEEILTTLTQTPA